MKIEVDSGVIERWQRVRGFVGASTENYNVHVWYKTNIKTIWLVQECGNVLLDELHRYIFEPETGPFHKHRRALARRNLLKVQDQISPRKGPLWRFVFELLSRRWRYCQRLVSELDKLESYYQGLPDTLPEGLTTTGILCLATLEKGSGWVPYTGRILGSSEGPYIDYIGTLDGSALDYAPFALQQAIEYHLAKCRQNGERSGLNPLLHYVDFSTLAFTYNRAPLVYMRASRYPGWALAGIDSQPDGEAHPDPWKVIRLLKGGLWSPVHCSKVV